MSDARGTRALRFARYDSSYLSACLALFDANCPEYFAPNERADYVEFLATRGDGYTVCLVDEDLLGAFGVYALGSSLAQLNWILLAPAAHGRGIGSAIMDHTQTLMRELGHRTLKISASHKSAPFFARFGATEVERVPDGWGPGMHRVEMTLLTGWRDPPPEAP